MEYVQVSTQRPLTDFLCVNADGDYDVALKRFKNLPAPTLPGDVVTKAYVDALTFGGGSFPFTVLQPSGGDDTPQIEAAISTGANIYFKPGEYILNSTVDVNVKGVRLLGSGTASTIFKPAAGITAFRFGGPAGNASRGSFSDCTIDGGNLGVWVDQGNNSFDLYNLSIQNCANGIQVSGNFNTTPRVDCIQTIIRDIEVHNHTGFAIRIFQNGDTHLLNIRTYGGFAVGSTGILVDSGATAIYATNCNILAADKGLLIRNTLPMNSDPGSLPRPGQFIFVGSLFDTCKSYAADIETTFQVKFHGCWFGGTQENEGLLIRSAVELELDSCHFIANAKHGLRVQAGNPVAHIKVIGGHFYANGRASVNTYDGAYFEAGVGHINIEGAQCYNDTGMNFTDSQRYGIYFADGNGNGNIVIGNNCLNNLQAQGIYYGATGTERQVTGNLPLIANIGTSTPGTDINFSTTMNPNVLANGQLHVQAFTVTGATPGDPIVAGLSSIGGAGWFLSAHCTSSNTVAVTLLNQTGASADLVSGTLKLRVCK